MKVYRSFSLVALFFMLMAVLPNLADATSYLYTYTGKVISGTDPNLDWKYMDDPDGKTLRVQFIYNGEDINTWTFSEQSVTNFTVTLGSASLVYNGLTGAASNASMTFYNADYTTKLPTRWFVSMSTIVPGASESYGLMLQTSYGLGDTNDQQFINEWRANYYYDPAIGGPVENQSAYVYLEPGIWQRTDASAVPLPSALLLLAPGLGGIAVLRRRFKA